jgi:hypothetical protein
VSATPRKTRKSATPAASVRVEGNVLRKPVPPPAAPVDEESLDRRRSPRRSECASGWLSNATGGTITSGRTVAINDLSLHGVGFTSSRPCQVGERHWILITRGHLRVSTRVRIVSARERPQGDGWDVGGEFF